MKKLRPYQEEAFSCIQKAINDGRSRSLLVMATGLGKTVVAVHLANLWLKQQTGKILFLIHMTEVVNQAQKEFESILKDGQTSAFWKGSQKDDLEDASIVFATFQSIDSMKDSDKESFSLVIVDEAHHAQARTYSAILDQFQPDFLFGMTATPERMDGLEIEDIFGDPVFEYNLPQALANKDLAEVDYRVLTDNIDLEVLQELIRRAEQGDRKITKKLIDRTVFMQERTDRIAKIVEEYREGRKQTIIFCYSIEHINHILPFFSDAVAYHSRLKMKKRDEILKRFRSGEIPILLVVDTFNEAVNVPEAELMVFLRATSSSRIWLQQLGRGLRKTATKSCVTVLDFVANCNRIVNVKILSEAVQESFDAIDVELAKSENGTRERSTFTLHTPGLMVSFLNETIALLGLLKQLSLDFYPTWKEASAAAIRLDFRTGPQYFGGYKANTRLPSSPHLEYESVWKENGGWPGFLNTIPYETWKEASVAAIRLGFRSGTQYLNGYKEDPRLVSNPYIIYEPVWKHNGGMKGFLDTIPYKTWKEASAAAIRLGFRTGPQYYNGYKEDRRLVSNPSGQYESVWKENGGWPGFLNTIPYETWKEASAAAIRLGFRTGRQYLDGYKEDPRLVSNPNIEYKDVWKQNGGMRGFLNTIPYETWEEASAAAIRLGFRSGPHYWKGYKIDLRLPSAPDKKYASVWKQNGGWPGFLGKLKK